MRYRQQSEMGFGMGIHGEGGVDDASYVSADVKSILTLDTELQSTHLSVVSQAHTHTSTRR